MAVDDRIAGGGTHDARNELGQRLKLPTEDRPIEITAGGGGGGIMYKRSWRKSPDGGSHGQSGEKSAVLRIGIILSRKIVSAVKLSVGSGMGQAANGYRWRAQSRIEGYNVDLPGPPRPVKGMQERN